MALEFPAAPNNGDVYDGYQYNATLGVWELIPSGGPDDIDRFKRTFLLMGA